MVKLGKYENCNIICKAETVSSKPVLKKVFKNPVFRPCVPAYLRTWESIFFYSSICLVLLGFRRDREDSHFEIV